jgi:cyclase
LERVIPSLALGQDARVASADPVEVAAAYAEAGANRLLFDARQTPFELLEALSRDLASCVSSRFSYRVEPSDPSEVAPLLSAGAHGIVVQSSALLDPDLIARLATELGGDAVAVAMIVRPEGSVWRVMEARDGSDTEWDAATWAAVIEAQGAGELIVESADPDPQAAPFDFELLQSVGSAFRRQVIADGVARDVADLFDALMIGQVDAVLVGSPLHSGQATIEEIIGYMADRGLAE